MHWVPARHVCQPITNRKGGCPFRSEAERAVLEPRPGDQEEATLTLEAGVSGTCPPAPPQPVSGLSIMFLPAGPHIQASEGRGPLCTMGAARSILRLMPQKASTSTLGDTVSEPGHWPASFPRLLSGIPTPHTLHSQLLRRNVKTHAVGEAGPALPASS